MTVERTNEHSKEMNEKRSLIMRYEKYVAETIITCRRRETKYKIIHDSAQHKSFIQLKFIIENFLMVDGKKQFSI